MSALVMMAGASGVAMADTPASEPDAGFVVLTFGSGDDKHKGEYTYDIQLLDGSAYSDDGRMTPVADIATAKNDSGIRGDDGYISFGQSAVNMSEALSGITAEKLEEWAEKGYAYTDDYGDATRYGLTLLVTQHTGDTGVETFGGFENGDGRAMMMGVEYTVEDNGGTPTLTNIATLDGACGGTAPRSLAETGDSVYAAGVAFCNIAPTQVHAVGHKHWTGDADENNLNAAYKDTFDLDLLYKDAEGDVIRPQVKPESLSTRSGLNGSPYVFTNGTDARWDDNGDIDFGTITIGLDDILNLDMSPIDPDGDSEAEEAKWYLAQTELSSKYTGTITYTLTEDGDAEQVTKPESFDDVIVNVNWNPLSNELTADIADPITVTNTYTAPKQVTVSFDTQAGDVSAPSAVSGNPGMTVPDPVVRRDGYRFTGWYLDPECTMPFSFDIPVQENTTLYAGWERIADQQYTVSFDAQAEGVTNPEPQVVDKGGTAVSPETEREGYTLTGWYLDPDCTQPYDFATPVQSDLTLYAGWDSDNDTTTGEEQAQLSDDGQTDAAAGTDGTQGLAQTGIGVASGIIGTLTLAIIGTVAALTRRRTLHNRN